MFGNRDIPVYLFTGFLESGKTTCIKEILEEGNFEDGLKTLFLITEEGEKEIDENLLQYNKVIPVVVEDEEDLTEEECNALVKEYKPARIMMEVNGMWNMAKLINETIPENWIIVQTFTTVNAETFEMYINNMKSLLMEHFKQSDLVIFNRCTQEMDKASMRRNVKAINRRAQVLFESEDGSVESNIEDRNRTFPPDAFVPARAAMTCCADDIAKIGFICHYNEAERLNIDDWVMVSVKVKPEFSKKNQSLYPVLWADKVEAAEPPEEEVVYFS